MKIVHTDADGNNYVYTETFWTAKASLTVNGEVLQNIGKKTFLDKDSNRITVSGQLIRGVSLNFSGGKKVVLCKNTWYEWILIILPMLVLFLGVLGGAIGGLFGGLFGYVGGLGNAIILRTKMNIFVKILCCLCVFALAFILWFLAYGMVVGGLALVFPSLFG